MKTRSITLSFLLIFLFQGFLKAQEETPEAILFNTAFPELSALAFDDKIKDMSDAEAKPYRDAMKRLKDANADLEAQSYGVLAVENAKVFNTNKMLKQLKKSKDIDGLKKMIADSAYKIKVYMGDKFKDGSSRQEATTNAALLQQESKRENYKSAYKHWNILFHFYPRFNKIIYSKGPAILEYKYNNAESDTEKSKWVDTLMTMYDQRIKFFGDNKDYPAPYILELKALDLIKYKPEKKKEAYEILAKAIKGRQEKASDHALYYYLKISDDLHKTTDPGKVLADYEKVMKLFEIKLKDPKTNGETQKMIQLIEPIMDGITLGKIMPFYVKKFNANKTNLEVLNELQEKLKKRSIKEKRRGNEDWKEAIESDLYFDIAVAIDKIKPSPEAKLTIGKRYFLKKDYDKGEQYVNAAIKLQTVDTLKAEYYYTLALFANEKGEKVESKNNAKKAIELKSNYGDPYILLATLYASSGCSSLSSHKGSLPGVAYWAAADKLLQAKRVDPSVTEDVKKLLPRYSRTPNKEDAFMMGISQGTRVTVGCWIGESTTARF